MSIKPRETELVVLVSLSRIWSWDWVEETPRDCQILALTTISSRWSKNQINLGITWWHSSIRRKLDHTTSTNSSSALLALSGDKAWKLSLSNTVLTTPVFWNTFINVRLSLCSCPHSLQWVRIPNDSQWAEGGVEEGQNWKEGTGLSWYASLTVYSSFIYDFTMMRRPSVWEAAFSCNIINAQSHSIERAKERTVNIKPISHSLAFWIVHSASQTHSASQNIDCQPAAML